MICRKILVLFVLGGYLSVAQANGIETGKIENIAIEGTANISVWLDGADYTAECANGGRWVIHTSDPLYKEKYAAILSAAAMKKDVTLMHLTSWGCDPSYNGNKVYYVIPKFN